MSTFKESGLIALAPPRTEQGEAARDLAAIMRKQANRLAEMTVRAAALEAREKGARLVVWMTDSGELVARFDVERVPEYLRAGPHAPTILEKIDMERPLDAWETGNGR